MFSFLEKPALKDISPMGMKTTTDMNSIKFKPFKLNLVKKEV